MVKSEYIKKDPWDSRELGLLNTVTFCMRYYKYGVGFIRKT